MAKSNQQPKTESCLSGGEPEDLWYRRNERLARSVLREKREPQVGPASCLSNPASKEYDASGEGVICSETNTETTAKGEVDEGLPESESVARVEGDTRNEGGPDSGANSTFILGYRPLTDQLRQWDQAHGLPPGDPTNCQQYRYDPIA
jgi:hypothetical protein